MAIFVMSHPPTAPIQLQLQIYIKPIEPVSYRMRYLTLRSLKSVAFPPFQFSSHIECMQN